MVISILVFYYLFINLFTVINLLLLIDLILITNVNCHFNSFNINPLHLSKSNYSIHFIHFIYCYCWIDYLIIISVFIIILFSNLYLLLSYHSNLLIFTLLCLFASFITSIKISLISLIVSISLFYLILLLSLIIYLLLSPLQNLKPLSRPN